MRWRSIGLLLLAVGAVATVVMTRQRPHGSVYAGHATSEWEREIANWEVSLPSCGSGGRYSLWVWRRPSFYANFCEDFGIPHKRDYARLPLVEGDPASLPVLIELLDSRDPKVRRIAVEGIRIIDDRETAVPLLQSAMQDSDFDVSWDAVRALSKWDKDSIRRWLETETQRAQISRSQF